MLTVPSLIVFLVAIVLTVWSAGRLIASTGPDGASTATSTTVGIALLVLAVRLRLTKEES